MCLTLKTEPITLENKIHSGGQIRKRQDKNQQFSKTYHIKFKFPRSSQTKITKFDSSNKPTLN